MGENQSNLKWFLWIHDVPLSTYYYYKKRACKVLNCLIQADIFSWKHIPFNENKADFIKKVIKLPTQSTMIKIINEELESNFSE